MLRLPFFVILVLISGLGQSQTRWNFLAGTTISSFDQDLMPDYGFTAFRAEYVGAGGSATSEATNSLKMGGFLGIEADIFLKEKTFIKVGLRYTSAGDAYYFQTDDIIYTNQYGSETDGKFKMRPRVDYLAIPLNYGIKTSDRFSIYGGLTPHLLMKNIIRTNKFTGGADDLEEKWDATENPVEANGLAIFANVGASFYLNDGKSVLNVNINRSLGAVYDDPDLQGFGAFNETGLWNVELGMGIFLFKSKAE